MQVPRNLADLLVPPTSGTHATLWQLLATKLCWACVSCVTSRSSCDKSLLASLTDPVAHVCCSCDIWSCLLRRMLCNLRRDVTLCDCESESIAIPVLKLYAEAPRVLGYRLR